jgi:hypothetical protein
MVGEFLDGDRFRNRHLAAHLLGRPLESLGLFLQPFGAAAEGGDGAGPPLVVGQRVGDGQLAAALLHVRLGAGGSRNLDVALDPRRLAAHLFFVVGFGNRGLGGEFLGRFLGLALAFFLAAVAGVVHGLAHGGGFAVAAVLFVMLETALGFRFLALALFGFAPHASAGAVAGFLLFRRQIAAAPGAVRRRRARRRRAARVPPLSAAPGIAISPRAPPAYPRRSACAWSRPPPTCCGHGRNSA